MASFHQVSRLEAFTVQTVKKLYTVQVGLHGVSQRKLSEAVPVKKFDRLGSAQNLHTLPFNNLHGPTYYIYM